MASPRPKYPLPLAIFLSVSGSIFFGVPRRSIARDSTKLLDSHAPRPIITGIEHIPKSGALMIVANHHQRENMWIGWAGAMVTEAVNSVRPARTPVRIVVTDSQRMKVFGQELAIPFSRYFLRRVAHFWEMIPMPTDPRAITGHAHSLRTTLGVLKHGLPVLLFPEGERGRAYRLIEAMPGTGTFIALASRRAAILPCSFWEDGDLFRGQISPPLVITRSDDSAVREQVMVAIGRLLPESMWGRYAEAIRHTG
ncbi:MAG: lysophospholipid acyltransferase family protein [Aggregatilineales bacterium]